METSWLIVAALALTAAVFAILMVRAQGANGFIRSELESARRQLAEAGETLAAKQGELDAAMLEISRLKASAGSVGEPPGPRGGSEVESEQAASSGTAHTIVRGPETTGPTETPDAATDEPVEAPRTMLYRPPPEDEPVDATAGMPYLKIGEGDEADQRSLVFGKTSVGRDKGCDILIQDAAASRSHFEIIYNGRRFLVKDNGSTNGTQHNGARVEEAPLEFGDTIRVGQTDMLFSCEGYDLKDSDASKAIESLEKCVSRQPDFVPALKILAFLLERDVGRKAEAAPLWESIAKLES